MAGKGVPRLQITDRLIFDLGTVLMRLVGARKVAQNADGLPQGSAAVASGSLDSLYAGFGN